MLVALDNNCPWITVERLERAGHEVVILARHESDEEWVDVALRRGAEVFVSNDLDIANLLNRWNSDASFIELPKRVRGIELAKWVVNQVTGVQTHREPRMAV
jgi:hypothetical protein